MNLNKYETWEGEVKVSANEDNGVSYLTVIFSALLGVLLLLILLFKTAFRIIFEKKSLVKKNMISIASEIPESVWRT